MVNVGFYCADQTLDRGRQIRHPTNDGISARRGEASSQFIACVACARNSDRRHTCSPSGFDASG
jgi:hypothetical protein